MNFMCDYCGSSVYSEMLFAEFTYRRCQNCKTEKLVSEVSPVYNENYYSMEMKQYSFNFFERLLIRGSFRKLIYTLFPAYFRYGLGPWYFENGAKKILDVGAGNGILVENLVEMGIPEVELRFYDKYATSLSPRRVTSLSCTNDQFDVVVLSHVLEHTDQPANMILESLNVLRPGGVFVLRVPVVSWFWINVARSRWIQRDAPNHKYIPSRKGLFCLMSSFDVVLENTYYDGGDFPWNHLFFGDSRPNLFLRVFFRQFQTILNLFRCGDQVTLVYRKVL